MGIKTTTSVILVLGYYDDQCPEKKVRVFLKSKFEPQLTFQDGTALFLVASINMAH